MSIRPLVHRLVLGLFAVGLFTVALAACSAGSENSGADDAAETVEPNPTIELFPIPSPTAQPTPTEVVPTPQATDTDGSDAAADGRDSGDTTGSDADAAPAQGVAPVVWTHVDGFDLGFSDGRALLAESVDTFYAVGDGDIAESVESILTSIDHPLGWQDAADAALATFPDGLGDSAGIFTLLSTQWAVIGCESHLAGMSRQSWNRHLFDHLVADAAGLPAEQADNQAGILLNGSNAAIDVLCPRLVRGV